MLCLPHAGGRGDQYRRWARDLAGRAEIWAADLPGRFRRSRMDALTNPDEVIAEISAEAAALADRPLAVFGHSMGALLGFEVTRTLEAAGYPVHAFIASGSPAPHLRAQRAPAGPFPDSKLIAQLRSWGTTDERLLSNAEVLGIVLPPLRADLTLCDRYQYRPGQVRAPALALAGTADVVAPLREVEAWETCCADWRGVHVIPGQHLFVQTAQPYVLAAVATFLATR